MSQSSNYSIVLKKENAHDDPIYCCWWAKTSVADPKDPPKDFIVTSGLDGLLKVWKIENNKLDLFHTLSGHSMAVVSVAVSPDGHTIASTSLDSSLIIWDLTSGSMVHEIETRAIDGWKVAFSPEGTQIATGSLAGKIMVYGIEKGTIDSVLDTRNKFTVGVAWSSNGKYISSGSVDGTVCIFDVAQGKLLHTFEAHTKPVRSVSFNSKSTQMVTASDDGFVKIYDVASASLVSKIPLKGWAMSAVFTRDGNCVAIGVSDGSIIVATTDKLQVLHTFTEHSEMVCAIQYNHDSSMLLSVSKDKSIIIYECPPPPKSNGKSNTVTMVK